MKFLKDEIVEIKGDGMVISASPFTNSQQAVVMDMINDESLVKRVELIKYLLKNCIKGITIGGKEMDPLMVADKSDLSDPDTISEFLNIGGLVIAEMFMGEEERKK